MIDEGVYKKVTTALQSLEEYNKDNLVEFKPKLWENITTEPRMKAYSSQDYLTEEDIEDLVDDAIATLRENWYPIKKKYNVKSTYCNVQYGNNIKYVIYDTDNDGLKIIKKAGNYHNIPKLFDDILEARAKIVNRLLDIPSGIEQNVYPDYDSSEFEEAMQGTIDIDELEAIYEEIEKH